MVTTSIRLVLALLVSSVLFLIGCGDDGGSPPVPPSFSFDEDTGGDEETGDEQGNEGSESDDSDAVDLDIQNPDGFLKPDTGDDEDGDTGEGDETASEEGGDPDVADPEDTSDTQAPVESCGELDDPGAADQWCSDNLNLTGCDTAYCVDGDCMVETVGYPDCCITSADCDDNNEITFDQCLGIEEGCSNQVDPTQCEDNVVLLQSTFDDGTWQGWSVVEADQTEVVGWQISTRRTHQGSFSVYFGHERCPTYFPGELTDDCKLPSAIPGQDPFYEGQCVANGENDLNEDGKEGPEDYTIPQEGLLISPEFLIPNDSAVFLGFNVYADFELFGNPSATPCAESADPFNCWDADTEADTADGLSVWVSYIDETTMEPKDVEVWNVVDLVGPFASCNKGTGDAFRQVGIDLSPFAGKNVSIKFEAHTDNAVSFKYEGAYIDSVSVKTGCEKALCNQDADCQSPNTCKSFECTDLVGSDGGFCFGGEVKENCTACPGGTHPECNDGNDCTSDLCGNDNTCNYTATADETCCEGGDAQGPFGFDNGLPAGWSIVGSGSSPVGWSVIDTGDDDKELYFGNTNTGTYADGNNQVKGEFITGFFVLDLVPYTLLATLELKLATEYEIAPYQPGQPALDQLTISVLSNEDGTELETLVFDSIADIGGATGVQQGEGTAVYENIGFDITPWQGQAIRLKFSFDTVNGDANEFGGVFIDNFALVEICEEPGCTKDNDCEDGFGCTIDSCVQGFCVSSKDDPLCCESDSECNDGNPCTNDSCEEFIGCVNEVSDPTCCYEATNVVSDFEDSDFGWTFDSISANVGWGFQEGSAAKEGNGFLYFGDPDTETYVAFEGTLSQGTAVSPSFEVSLNGGTALNFDLFMETEWDENLPILCDSNCKALLQVNDVLTIRVRDQFFVETDVWSSSFLNNTTAGEYIPVNVNLSPWAGETVQVIFEFKTTDSLFNEYAGVRIDNLETFVICDSAVECFSDLDCSDTDGDECTSPQCDNYTCSEVEILKLPECCFETPILNTNFDSNTLEGFEIVGLICGEDTFSEECIQNDNAEVRWQLSTLKSHSPNHSLWFGNALTETYAHSDGLAVSGWAESTQVGLFPGLPAYLDMWVYLDVEAFTASFPNIDRFEVIVVQDGGQEVVVWDKAEMVPDDMGNWININVDLSEFAGQGVSIMVEFDSQDYTNNETLGVFVDDVRIIQGCND